VATAFSALLGSPLRGRREVASPFWKKDIEFPVFVISGSIIVGFSVFLMCRAGSITGSTGAPLGVLVGVLCICAAILRRFGRTQTADSRLARLSGVVFWICLGILVAVAGVAGLLQVIAAFWKVTK
jgi:hypothetical protein